MGLHARRPPLLHHCQSTSKRSHIEKRSHMVWKQRVRIRNAKCKMQMYTRGTKVLKHPVINGCFLRANGLLFEIYITKLSQCRGFFHLNSGWKIFVIHSTSNQNKLLTLSRIMTGKLTKVLKEWKWAFTQTDVQYTNRTLKCIYFHIKSVQLKLTRC